MRSAGDWVEHDSITITEMINRILQGGGGVFPETRSDDPKMLEWQARVNKMKEKAEIRSRYARATQRTNVLPNPAMPRIAEMMRKIAENPQSDFLSPSGAVTTVPGLMPKKPGGGGEPTRGVGVGSGVIGRGGGGVAGGLPTTMTYPHPPPVFSPVSQQQQLPPLAQPIPPSTVQPMPQQPQSFRTSGPVLPFPTGSRYVPFAMPPTQNLPPLSRASPSVFAASRLIPAPVFPKTQIGYAFTPAWLSTTSKVSSPYSVSGNPNAQFGALLSERSAEYKQAFGIPDEISANYVERYSGMLILGGNVTLNAENIEPVVFDAGGGSNNNCLFNSIAVSLNTLCANSVECWKKKYSGNPPLFSGASLREEFARSIYTKSSDGKSWFIPGKIVEMVFNDSRRTENTILVPENYKIWSQYRSAHDPDLSVTLDTVDDTVGTYRTAIGNMYATQPIMGGTGTLQVLTKIYSTLVIAEFTKDNDIVVDKTFMGDQGLTDDEVASLDNINMSIIMNSPMASDKYKNALAFRYATTVKPVTAGAGSYENIQDQPALYKEIQNQMRLGNDPIITAIFGGETASAVHATVLDAISSAMAEAKQQQKSTGNKVTISGIRNGLIEILKVIIERRSKFKPVIRLNSLAVTNPNDKDQFMMPKSTSNAIICVLHSGHSELDYHYQTLGFRYSGRLPSAIPLSAIYGTKNDNFSNPTDAMNRKRFDLLYHVILNFRRKAGDFDQNEEEAPRVQDLNELLPSQAAPMNLGASGASSSSSSSSQSGQQPVGSTTRQKRKPDVATGEGQQTIPKKERK